MRSLLVGAFCIVFFTGCSSSGSEPVEKNESNSENAGLDSSEFCPTGALYDKAEDLCYVDCDGLSDNQCDAMEEEVFGDFDEFVVDNFSGAETDNLNGETAKARYQIQSDLTLTTLANTEPENDKRFKEIWTGVNNVLPRTNVIEAFSQYHVDSDGVDGALAYVTIDVNQPGKWILALDDADYISPAHPEFIHTSIHEFGHFVFLGGNQLDTNATGSCPNYAIAEGCSNKDSYINKFYQQFWADIIDEHAALQTTEQEAAFYEKYKDRFVSEYSATNPVEDTAEVFTNFVLREKPTSSDTVVDQKILMMHGIQALVKLRNDIRGKLTITRARMQKNKQ